MNKLKHYWENLIIILEFIMEHPKKMLVLVLILITLLVGAYNRGGSLWSCWKTAWYEQGVDTENFEFKVLTGACVVKRSDGRWLPVTRAADISESAEEE